MHKFAQLVAGLVMSATASLASAGVFNFTFTDATTHLIDASGTFVTGAAAADAGYFLLTDMTFFTIRDQGGVLNTGPFKLSPPGFTAGAAYNPASGAFINHRGGDTFDDFGGALFSDANGSTPSGYGLIQVDGSDFSLGTQTGRIGFSGSLTGRPGISQFNFGGTLSIVQPSGIPEPMPLALIGVGLLAAVIGKKRSRGQTV